MKALINKAVFLDRDGTINADKEYIYKIQDFEFLPGVIEGLKILQNLGYLLIIVTNQSGIGRGYYTEEEFEELNYWMLSYLENLGIHVEGVYFCPHLPDAKIKKYRKDCTCRKPKLGMYERAIEKFDIDISNSWTIGDKIRDCSICCETDCKGILISHNEEKSIIEKVKKNYMKNIRYAENLLGAAKLIEEREAEE